jgi:hypothetical protein
VKHTYEVGDVMLETLLTNAAAGQVTCDRFPAGVALENFGPTAEDVESAPG